MDAKKKIVVLSGSKISKVPQLLLSSNFSIWEAWSDREMVVFIIGKEGTLISSQIKLNIVTSLIIVGLMIENQFGMTDTISFTLFNIFRLTIYEG